LDGWVSRPSPPSLLPAFLPPTAGFTPLAGSICPTEPTESRASENAGGSPLHPFTPEPPPFAPPGELHRRRRVLRRCRTGGDTTSCCCSLLSNKPRIRGSLRSIGFLSSSSSSRPESGGLHFRENIERGVNTHLISRTARSISLGDRILKDIAGRSVASRVDEVRRARVERSESILRLLDDAIQSRISGSDREFNRGISRGSSMDPGHFVASFYIAEQIVRTPILSVAGFAGGRGKKRVTEENDHVSQN